MSTSINAISNMAAIPFLAFAFLFAGLASAAIGDALYASSTGEDAAKSIEIAQSITAAFYVAGTVLLLLISIRFFTWKQKMKLPLVWVNIWKFEI